MHEIKIGISVVCMGLEIPIFSNNTLKLVLQPYATICSYTYAIYLSNQSDDVRIYIAIVYVRH